MKILVSISCTTYNHASYLRKCLDGFIMQQCNFNFEILVHDDASTDNTIQIINEYQKKFPLLIKPIIQEKNQWSQGVRGMNATYNYSRAKGKYIAMCEGDDYWTDPYKLQKQVDFMEANPDCSVCFPKTLVKTYQNKVPDHFYGLDLEKSTKFSLEDFIKTDNAMGVRTVGLLFKKEAVIDYPEWCYKAPVGDLALQLLLGTKGHYGYLPEVMTVYNRGNPGAWSADNHTVKGRIKQIEHLNKTYDLFDEYTEGKYHEMIRQRNKKWIVSRIEYIQVSYGRSEQLKVLLKYFKDTLPYNKRNLIVWMRFLLGKKLIDKLA